MNVLDPQLYPKTATQTSTLLAISTSQTWFTDRQLAALQHMGVGKDVPRGDLAIFLNQCQRTGLDPFAKQIYMLGRNVRENDGWVKKYTIQTGIDGYRVIGDRVAERRGDEIEHHDPLWADSNGVWTDVWLSDEPPVAAKYTIIKNGKRNVATVMYREFVQTRKDGTPNTMWQSMPCNQLAKCAEMQAWKKIYPNDFAGLVMEGTALPSEDVHTAAEPARASSPRVSADEIMTHPLAGTEQIELAAPQEKTSARKRASNKMFAYFREAGLEGDDNREDRLIVTSKLVGREVNSSENLTEDELGDLNKQLANKRATLGNVVREILNEHTLAAENQQPDDPDEGQQESLL